MSHIHTIRLLLEGRVQGVGFRPFVCRTALSLGLTGWVKNLGGVVEIRASGDREALLALERKLEEAPYPVAVEKVTKEEVPLENFSTFSAIESSGEPLAPLFPADIAICPSCRKELHDRKDRHFQYPFLSCTACGPRYTIIRSLPYDRPRTAMDSFPLCPECQREYEDLKNRRCHGETICCAACGPALSMVTQGGEEAQGEKAMERAIALVKAGKVVMVKSIGGFQLVCRGDRGGDGASPAPPEAPGGEALCPHGPFGKGSRKALFPHRPGQEAPHFSGLSHCALQAEEGNQSSGGRGAAAGGIPAAFCVL